VNYGVRFSRQIQHQIAQLPGSVRNQAKQRILALRNHPRPPDARELENHPGFYRIWLDRDFRLIWQVDDDAAVVDIFYVGPKTEDLYGRLGLGR
jgi:mRNA-degrading endonuclease RelE of RelBE toxin-antitoxin system